jgi:hypothetical protein
MFFESSCSCLSTWYSNHRIADFWDRSSSHRAVSRKWSSSHRAVPSTMIGGAPRCSLSTLGMEWSSRSHRARVIELSLDNEWWSTEMLSLDIWVFESSSRPSLNEIDTSTGISRSIHRCQIDFIKTWSDDDRVAHNTKTIGESVATFNSYGR